MLSGQIFAAGIRIDHATVAGSNLKAMQSALSAAGVPTVYGGAHTNGATEMAIASFPDGSYLELMAFRTNADPAQKDRNVRGKFLKADAGPCAWAAREENMTVEIQRLKTAGIAVAEPEKSGRQRPDGVHLQWEMASVGEGPRGTFFPFLIHDFTPRDQRAFPQGGPVTREFRGIAEVVIGVRDLDEAVARYRRAYGASATRRQVDEVFGARLAMVEGIPVVFAQPLNGDSWLGKRIHEFGEAPCAIVLAGSKAGRQRASRWFGRDISWVDTQKLGWHLGVVD